MLVLSLSSRISLLEDARRMKFVILVALLATLAHGYPNRVQCDYSTSNSGDIRSLTSISRMSVSNVETEDCVQISPSSPQANEAVTVTFTCGGSGYSQGLVHVKKSDNGADSALSDTTNSGSSKCNGARVEWGGGLGASVQLTWTPADAGEYEIVAVAGKWGALRREVMLVDVTDATEEPTFEPTPMPTPLPTIEPTFEPTIYTWDCPTTAGTVGHCERCLYSSQCPDSNYFCCPIRKLCLSRISPNNCVLSHADCWPSCSESQSGYPDTCNTCTNSLFPDQWVVCDPPTTCNEFSGDTVVQNLAIQGGASQITNCASMIDQMGNSMCVESLGTIAGILSLPPDSLNTYQSMSGTLEDYCPSSCDSCVDEICTSLLSTECCITIEPYKADIPQDFDGCSAYLNQKANEILGPCDLIAGGQERSDIIMNYLCPEPPTEEPTSLPSVEPTTTEMPTNEPTFEPTIYTWDCPTTAGTVGHCERCLYSSQCPDSNYFCCPIRKLCLSRISSNNCELSPADCWPSCSESQSGYPDTCNTCTNSLFPDQWVVCDPPLICDESSGNTVVQNLASQGGAPEITNCASMINQMGDSMCAESLGTIAGILSLPPDSLDTYQSMPGTLSDYCPSTCQSCPEPTTDPTPQPTVEPTAEPTHQPTKDPTMEPTHQPTNQPTQEPTKEPTKEPTQNPTNQPTQEPTKEPTKEPTNNPTKEPTHNPTREPTQNPTKEPTQNPTKEPTQNPTKEPTQNPTKEPTQNPSKEPTKEPTQNPTKEPTQNPTKEPSQNPTKEPTQNPTKEPTKEPTQNPTKDPTKNPTLNPTGEPTRQPTKDPTQEPTTTEEPTKEPSLQPTKDPTQEPTKEPTQEPTIQPTKNPTKEPTQTKEPTKEPTIQPTKDPTQEPTQDPTKQPTIQPTKDPTQEPTKEPTKQPTNEPTPAEPKVAPFHLCSNNSLQKLKDYDAFTETNLYGFSCLYLAVRKQNKEMFKILNEVEDDDKILLNHKTTGSQGTALHLASVSHHSHWFVVRLARRSGIDCNAQNKFLSTPLMQAVEINSYWYTKALTENCPSVDVTVQGNNGNTALHQAIYKKSGEVFDMICSHAKATGQSLDTTNNQGKTALHLAVDRFNVDQVRSLMTNGADANIANTHGGLPLYNHWHNPTGKLIDQEGLIEMATLMLENGADPTIKSWPNLMRSAFSRFAFGSRPDELKAKYFELLIVLLKSGADINDMSGGQNGIFCKMINSGKVQAVRRIIEENLVDVDHQCWKGARKYPLHLAILGKKDEIAKILIDAGANIRLRDAYGARPIDIARNKHKEFFAEHFAGMRRN